MSKCPGCWQLSMKDGRCDNIDCGELDGKVLP